MHGLHVQSRKTQDTVHQKGALKGELDDVRLEDVVNVWKLAGFDGKGRVSLGGVEPQQSHVVLICASEFKTRFVHDDELRAAIATAGGVVVRGTAGTGGLWGQWRSLR